MAQKKAAKAQTWAVKVNVQVLYNHKTYSPGGMIRDLDEEAVKHLESLGVVAEKHLEGAEAVAQEDADKGGDPGGEAKDGE